MIATRRWALLWIFGAVTGCSQPPGAIDASADAALDGAPHDAAVLDAGGAIDTGVSVDGGASPDGPASCEPPSTGTPFSGCNPTLGIECDGDWRGINARTGSEYCSPACAATDCCTPRMGAFVCVPRDAAGACPAADLFPDASHITGDYAVEYRSFSPTSCAIAEMTLGGAGTRRLLRFDTWTPNIGNADMFLGVPDTTSGRFTYSACHMHYHFDTYASYELLTSDGRCVVARGHKQAFCLEDFYHYPAPLDRTGSQYDCSYQGIEMNWQDVYARIYDGQWIDVTDVTPGDYVLRVRLNVEHILNESNYDNNVIDVPVTIPVIATMGTDITSTCPAGTMGLARTCGFVHAYDGSCTPGAIVTVGCSATCALGSCTGDTVLRVCDTAVGVNCTQPVEITSNDDSGCGTGACGGGGDCCSQATFTCPSGGAYTVWTGSYDTSQATTCTIAHMP